MKYTIKWMGLLLVIILITGLTSLNCLASNVEYEYYVEEGEAILTKYIGNEKEVTIPCEIDGYKVRELKGTFYENAKIKKVVLEEGITLIGEETFYGCNALKKVAIADTVRRLDRYAFAYCGIEKITLPSNTHFINEGCFYGCDKLEIVVSQAEPLWPSETALYIGKLAFANSNIKVIKTEYTPSFYDNTFTTDCRFTDSEFMCYAYKSNLLSPIVKLLQRSSRVQAAILLMLLFFGLTVLVISTVYFVRLILSLFGKDNVANYNKYSRRVFSEIDSTRNANEIVHYNKIVLPIEKSMGFLKIVLAIITIFAYIALLFYISSIVQLDFGVNNPFIRAAITIFGTIFLTIIVVWLLGKLRMLISDRKKEADKPHIRIKFVIGGKKMLNKTFRLFISSTFSDFILERNILNDEIFPIVDDYCQQRGYNFQLIDLRWGVNNESALNQNTIAICLDEVKRCRTLSPKPNFLVMAGERYGWIPLPAKISKNDFYEIMSVATSEEKEIITEWYILDENEIGGEFYLKTRSGKYVDDELWFQTESDVYNALKNCVVNKLNMSEEKVRLITSSATEQEIFEGLLDYKGISNNTIAVFRTNYPERDKNQEKIENLKRRIIQKMNEDGCEENILNLEWNSSYRDAFKQTIVEILLKNISLEIDRLSKEIASKNNGEEIDQIIESTGFILDRPIEKEKIEKYLTGDSNKPLFLYGDSGSGKTTLLAQFIKNDKRKFFHAFYGWGENHYTLLSSIEDIIGEIKEYYEIAKEFNVNEFNITESFISALYAIPNTETAVIVLDGFDMFHDVYLHEIILQ